MKKIFISIMTALVSLTASAQHGEYVGGDISMLPEYEAHNSAYLDGNGKKIDDLLIWLVEECGWNSFRVRLFVNPTNAKHDGVVQDLEYVKKLGKRIKAAGASFMLDIHYSDTWADALSHAAPVTWTDFNTAEKRGTKVYEYTKEVMLALVADDAAPDFVQIGNEMMYGMAGVNVHPTATAGDDWDSMLAMVNGGCKAVREVCPKAQIVLHTDRPGNTGYNKFFYDKFAQSDYDVIGLSYYPFWHGTLSSLKTALAQLKNDFPGKKVQIVETAYNYQYWPSEGINYDTRSTWASTADGQYAFVKDLLATLKDCDNVNGLYYWFPEEAGNGDDTNWSAQSYGTVLSTWLNRGLWYSNNSSGHWPVKASEGMVTYLMKDFLGTTTDVEATAAVADKNGNGMRYNLAGQRVAPSYKGVVVVNGKKFFN